MNKNSDLLGVDGNSVRDQDGGATSEGTFFFNVVLTFEPHNCFEFKSNKIKSKGWGEGGKP